MVILPGLGNNASDYDEIASQLRQRGLDVEVVQIARLDWARNAAGLLDINWWKGTLKPRPIVDWYLDRVDDAMTNLQRRIGASTPITMLTHSAGGWLGRVYMLDFGTASIDRFVSLGSPHAPPPAGAQGVVDQTRGILTFCEDSCPGAYHGEVKYVTIAGKYVKGVPLNGEGGLKAKIAGAGYQQVCGDAEVWGDFIVPQPSAHLDGAINVDLEGVFHSPLGTKLPFFGPWYGSPEFLDLWAHYVSDDWESLQPGDYVYVDSVPVPPEESAAAASS